MGNIFKLSIFVALVFYFAAVHAIDRHLFAAQDSALKKSQAFESLHGDYLPVKDSLLMFHNDNPRFAHANRVRRFAIENIQPVSNLEIPISNVIETSKKTIQYSSSPDEIYTHKSAKRAVPLTEQYVNYRNQMKLQSLDQNQLDQIFKQYNSKFARVKRSFVPKNSFQQQITDMQNSAESFANEKNLKAAQAENSLNMQKEAYNVKYICPNNSDCPFRNNFHNVAVAHGQEQQPMKSQSNSEALPIQKISENQTPSGHSGKQSLQNELRWFPAMSLQQQHPLQQQQQQQKLHLPVGYLQGMHESHDKLQQGNSFPRNIQNYNRQMHPGRLSYVREELYPDNIDNQQSYSNSWIQQPNFAQGVSASENALYYPNVDRVDVDPRQDPLVNFQQMMYEGSAYSDPEQSPRKNAAPMWSPQTEVLGRQKDFNVKRNPASVKIYTLKPGEPLDLPKEIAPYVHGFDVPVASKNRPLGISNIDTVENALNSHIQSRSVLHTEFQKLNHSIPKWGKIFNYETSVPYARNLMPEFKSNHNLHNVANERTIYY